jgi:hypothetical protein
MSEPTCILCMGHAEMGVLQHHLATAAKRCSEVWSLRHVAQHGAACGTLPLQHALPTIGNATHPSFDVGLRRNLKALTTPQFLEMMTSAQEATTNGDGPPAWMNETQIFWLPQTQQVSTASGTCQVSVTSSWPS